jgi:hypothetical protein
MPDPIQPATPQLFVGKWMMDLNGLTTTRRRKPQRWGKKKREESIVFDRRDSVPPSPNPSQCHLLLHFIPHPSDDQPNNYSFH